MTEFLRKRKTKDPCPGCFLHRQLCLCAEIPSLDLKTKVSLVVHAKELKRTTNTGRLAVKALLNSEMKVRGQIANPLDLSCLLDPAYQSFLFYPAEGALELNQEFQNRYCQRNSKPIQLIVPDGNWRQASKVHYRHHELKDIPRVKISSANPAQYHLRAESFPEGMATLEAIAWALGVLEGPAVKQALMTVYQTKLQRTLESRGQTIVANLQSQ